MTEINDSTERVDAAAPPAAPVARPPRRWLPYLVCILVGLALGVGFAMRTVRQGALGDGQAIGAWTTGRDFGTADQSAKTRAVVAMRGLLALPASEARYYTAAIDDGGRKLAANCTYRITGGALPARWWSLTLYDPQGYLVANDREVFSIGSANLPPAEQNRWTVLVSPTEQPGRWLPTGGDGNFELTLRAYLPADGGAGNLTAAQLPSIRRETCA